MRSNSRRPQAVPPGRQPGLLGTYPLPLFHLVGVPIRPNPHLPNEWRPAPPLLQYGIDYTFAHRAGRGPVRWQHGSGITVRIIGTSSQDRHTAVTKVVAELRALTQLDLVTGESWPTTLNPSTIPVLEIHVGYLTTRQLAAMSACCANRAGLGGAALCADGPYYVSGFAIVNADVTGPDATAGHALAILRHQLGHALGLGHAARRGLLMHYQIAVGTTQYGRGDRHGLALLGQALPPGTTAPGDHPRVRTPPCAV